MMEKIYRISLWSIFIALCGCSQFTYRPHSAKQKYFARPHVQFMMAVLNYRELYGVWPPSLNDLSVADVVNRKIIHNFQYQTVEFVIKSNDKLIVYFTDYKKQPYISNEGKFDLNGFRGLVTFFKSNGQFVWKVKMK